MEGAPQSHLTLEDGTPVLTSDGHRIGVVAHVLSDDMTAIFDGIIIDTGGLAGGHRFVDAPDVDDIREDAVVLALDRAAAQRLPEPTESPAVVEGDGTDFGDDTLSDKLRRAWDWVSGRY
ncbi:PRC-barrel domain-containing protein [Conexibacter sp. SYSU D00693]|uniref:PRC-barrel domain-containing protein n=1 Tax=Conexibacter sp. SYSU D00693 TaxID=2812560 RepID=UPI00196B6240|nr:PRC-barrel domain-containing protein [Conexibacter sp. SYSU D00693]